MRRSADFASEEEAEQQALRERALGESHKQAIAKVAVQGGLAQQRGGAPGSGESSSKSPHIARRERPRITRAKGRIHERGGQKPTLHGVGDSLTEERIHQRGRIADRYMRVGESAEAKT